MAFYGFGLTCWQFAKSKKQTYPGCALYGVKISVHAGAQAGALPYYPIAAQQNRYAYGISGLYNIGC